MSSSIALAVPSPLRVLVLEDSERDYELILHRLRREVPDVQAVRVESEESFARELDRGYDVVVAGLRLSGLDALRALELRDSRAPETPLIVVSDTAGDEQIAAAIKHGAADYLLKDRLGRLAQAIRNALREQRLLAASAHAHAEVRRGEERLRLMIDSIQDYAIFVLDERGAVASWNPGAERIHGYTEREALGRSMADLLLADGATQADVERVLARARERGGVEDEGERTRGDGERFRANVVVRPLRPATHDAGFLVVVRDVTEQRELEAQLQQSQKMEAVGRLAGGVAHDFNNLLTVITGSAEILTEDLDADDPRRADAEEIRRAAERGAALTRQLLAFSHRQVRQPRTIDLRAVVDEMDSLLARVIGEHIEVVTEAPPAPLPVRVDPTEIEQVVMNLAVNSRDAMAEGGRLVIRLEHVSLDKPVAARLGVAPGAHARLGVIDTGRGMSPDVMAHVFEPFFTTKERGQGTGLGLATVYGIVAQSGGHVGVSSREGAGTTITIHLPLTRAPLPSAAGPEDALGPRFTGTETILLVEDDPAVRRLAGRTLERAGYLVLVAENAAAAAALWARAPVDLLLTDVVMPGANGVELAQRFSADRPGASVLFMSGYTEGVLVDRAARETDVPFLQKPFTPAQLARRVREVLDGAATSAGGPAGQAD